VILIMTSNAGAREMAGNVIGFGATRDSALKRGSKAIEKAFSPEFRNRLDAIVTFNSLPIETIRQVVNKFIQQLNQRLADRKVELVLSDEARDWLADTGYDESFGARPLARLIQREVENKLSDEILFGKLEKGGSVEVRLEDGQLQFAITPRI
jgi:ATP-dependent Clp protease ATP-binding subunit ClpA